MFQLVSLVLRHGSQLKLQIRNAGQLPEFRFTRAFIGSQLKDVEPVVVHFGQVLVFTRASTRVLTLRREEHENLHRSEVCRRL